MLTTGSPGMVFRTACSESCRSWIVTCVYSGLHTQVSSIRIPRACRGRENPDRRQRRPAGTVAQVYSLTGSGLGDKRSRTVMSCLRQKPQASANSGFVVACGYGFDSSRKLVSRHGNELGSACLKRRPELCGTAGGQISLTCGKQ